MVESLVSLWEDEDLSFLNEKKIVKKIREKINATSTANSTRLKINLNLDEKIQSVTNEVIRILGNQKDNFILIKDYESYINYIKEAIKVGEIAIDTETNNTLDYLNCKLMGLCLYYPGGKQAYIPVNHIDKDTKERLSWQLTEEQISEGLKLIYKNRPKFEPRYEDDFYGDWYREVLLPRARKDFPYTIFQNGKFDYQVLKCTCGIECVADWDTLIATKILDENTYDASLKGQYKDKIDKEQEKYNIEHLFQGLEYAIFDPEIFAYYASTDAFMTYKLYEYQIKEFLRTENERLYKLAIEVEMPCVQITAEMELTGVYYDLDYSNRLKEKYHTKLNILNDQLTTIIALLNPIIQSRRETNEAKSVQWKKQSNKQRLNAVKSPNYDDSLWKNVQSVWYKKSKSKVEQLDQEITVSSLESPTQLAIIIYDILKYAPVNKDKPNATGEAELKILKENSKSDNFKKFITLIQESRELNKLINAFIDSLPKRINEKDGRIHGKFNQYGTATGRYSSSDPNLQQIPSHNKELRMLFRAEDKFENIEITDNYIELNSIQDVLTEQGWINIKKINIGDSIQLNDGSFSKILDIQNNKQTYKIYI